MAMASKLLAFLSATPFFLLLLLLPTNVHSQPDTTSFQFDVFSTDSKDLTFERDAFVPPSSTFLRLTKTDASSQPRPSSVGRVLYSPPVKFSGVNRHASFETTIRFTISTVHNDPADGMTFFIVPVNSTKPTGGEGGSLGIFNALLPNSPVFAVEFDTYVNSHVDPNLRHVGINLNSKLSANVTSFEDAVGQVVTARINYEATTRRISVVTMYGSGSSEVSYESNLKRSLPELVQVGISASTGAQVAVHDVYSWYFTSTLVWEPHRVLENLKPQDGDADDEKFIRQYSVM